MTKYFILVLFAFTGTKIISQTCTVRGNAGSYAGEVLNMYRYTDYLTKKRVKIASSEVDNEGYFKFEIESDYIFEAVIDLDVFLGKIVIEPGKDIKILLPLKTVRSESDVMNPYFRQIEFYAKVVNDNYSTNITNAISKFNRLYASSFDIVFKNPRHINSGTVELEIQKISDSLSYIENKYFDDYTFYKFLQFRTLAYYKNNDAVIRKNYSNKEILYDNPAYNDLLINEFGTYMFEEKKDTLYKIIYQVNDWKSLNNYLVQDDKYLDKDFREYFLCINLFKMFFRNADIQQKIIQILNTAQSSNLNIHTKQIISQIIQSSGSLITGCSVKDFNLYDQHRERVSLTDFFGDFIYLAFFNKDSYACQKDQILLKSLYDKKYEKLTIICVYVDPDHKSIIDLANKNKLEYEVLHCYDNDDILEDYKVIAYPTYYLIHPNGTLILNPAPGPAEDFEAIYNKTFIEYKRQLIRGNN